MKERERQSIWNLHWGAASSASMGLCGELLSVGSMGGEDRVGGRTSCGCGSWPPERRGLGGAGRSAVPAGETACRQGRHWLSFCNTNCECDTNIVLQTSYQTESSTKHYVIIKIFGFYLFWQRLLFPCFCASLLRDCLLFKQCFLYPWIFWWWSLSFCGQNCFLCLLSHGGYHC